MHCRACVSKLFHSSVNTQQQATVQLLCHLYVQRSFVFWKKPDHAQWLSETIMAMSQQLLSSSTLPEEPATLILSLRPQQSSIYRHVIVLEQSCRRLFSFIPKEVLNARQVSCDPLPPASRINEYNAEFFRGVEDAFAYNPRRRNRREEQEMLERLIPDPIFRRQLQVCLYLSSHWFLLDLSCRSRNRRSSKHSHNSRRGFQVVLSNLLR
jgi:Transcriptional repressor TCF25